MLYFSFIFVNKVVTLSMEVWASTYRWGSLLLRTMNDAQKGDVYDFEFRWPDHPKR